MKETTLDTGKFYFNSNVHPPLKILKKELRTEAEYDADPHAEKTELRHIGDLSRKLQGNTILITASRDIAPQNNLRTKNGTDAMGPNLANRNLQTKSTSSTKETPGPYQW